MDEKSGKMRGEASDSDVGVEQDRNGDGKSVVLCVSDEVSRQVVGEESVALNTRDECCRKRQTGSCGSKCLQANGGCRGCEF